MHTDMKSLKKGTLLACGTVMACCAAGSVAIISTQTSNSLIEAEDAPYTLALTGGSFSGTDSHEEGDDWAANTYTADHNGYELTYYHYNCEKGSEGGNLVTLYTDTYQGYIFNQSKLTALSQVNVVFTADEGASLLMLRGWYDSALLQTWESEVLTWGNEPGTAKNYYDIVWQDDDLGTTLVSDAAVSFGGIAPNYLKFVAVGGNVTIASITYTYDCPQTAPTSVTLADEDIFRLHTKSGSEPNFGGSSTLNEGVYLWLNYGFSSQSKWENKIFTYDEANAYWYVDFSASDVGGTYSVNQASVSMGFSILLGNSSSPDWDYVDASYNSYKAYFSQGQTEITLWNALRFDEQPSTSTGTLNVTVTFTDWSDQSYDSVQLTGDFGSSKEDWTNVEGTSTSNGTWSFTVSNLNAAWYNFGFNLYAEGKYQKMVKLSNGWDCSAEVTAGGTKTVSYSGTTAEGLTKQ